MKVEIMRAWPRRFERVVVDLPPGASVHDAVNAAGWGEDMKTVAYAIFGQRATPETALHEGDRVELLRPLQADPKEARRQRVEERRRLERK